VNGANFMGSEVMSKYHEIERIAFEDDNLSLTVDGQKHIFPLSKISNRLALASKIERESYQISPSGYGIHWPLVDEDLSIDGLLGISHKPPEKKQLAGVSR
jgi:hypothetical protein